MKSDDPTQAEAARFFVHQGPVPFLGQTIFEREMPSDPALVAPVVVRIMECLKKESMVLPDDENKVGMCLEEALMNGVIHGNRRDFQKKVRVRVFMGESEWGFVVSDEGAGFDPSKVRSPLQSDTLWGETGRGLYLISHYMDRMAFYGGGNSVVMARHL
jgi:serine/threonine-protein kinase RsbW